MVEKGSPTIAYFGMIKCMTPIPQQWLAVMTVGLSLGLRTGQAGPPFTLVQDGRSTATIVTAAAA